jgi:hypothetical protein
MRQLLLVRTITIAIIFLFINKWNPDLTTPLSTFASILHEMGHSVGALVSGGEVSGMTLAPDCPCLYACTRGGNALITLLGGNIFSILAAFGFVYYGRIMSKFTEFIFPTYVILGLLMFITVRLVADERILSIWMIVIYLLLFIFFILTQTGWAGAFLIFFGFMNLLTIIKDTLAGGVLSDISRYSHFLDNPKSPALFTALWFGIVGYNSVLLINQVSATKVDWIEGRRFFKNIDTDKILLFFSILPNMIGFAFDQLFEFLVVEFQGVFDGIRRFLSI